MLKSGGSSEIPMHIHCVPYVNRTHTTLNTFSTVHTNLKIRDLWVLLRGLKAA